MEEERRGPRVVPWAALGSERAERETITDPCHPRALSPRLHRCVGTCVAAELRKVQRMVPP